MKVITPIPRPRRAARGQPDQAPQPPTISFCGRQIVSVADAGRGPPVPQIAKHRGAQTRKGSYWGPVCVGLAVNQTVTAMQRVFLLRSCADTVFAGSHRGRACCSRSRRCSAPVRWADRPAEYGKLVAQAKAFLAGKSRSVAAELAAEMEAAAATLGSSRGGHSRPHPRADVRAGQTMW